MFTRKSAESFDFHQAIHEKRVAGLWNIIQGYQPLYIWAIVAMALSAAFKAANYFLLRYFIDGILAGGSIVISVIALIAAGFIALALFEGAATFSSRQSAAFVAENTAQRVRDYVYDHLQRLSFSFHDSAQTGELIQRATSDVDAIRRFYADQAILAGRIVLLFLVNFIGILSLSLPLALVSVIAVPFIALMSVYFFKKVSDAYEAFQEQEARLSTAVQEHLSGVRVVRAFARQDYEADLFERENREQFRLGKHLLSIHSLYWPLSGMLAGVQMIGGFIVGALMTINGTLSVGTYTAYAGMLIWLIWPMRNIGRLIVEMSVGLVSFERVTNLVREDREPLDAGTYQPSGSPKGHIVFDDVSFEYEPTMPVLRHISFEAKPGEVVALLGATGAGKTSLLSLLPRFYDYTSGNIRLDGVELRDYSRRYLRRHIGIVEQEPFLFSRTIRENIAFGVGRAVSDEEIERAAQAAAIHNVIMEFPDGYMTLVGERGVTLSGGQKQRVAIARTLLKNPAILILDDATSSVDTETESNIRSALHVLMENRTTFIIAHRIQSVMIADQILVMEAGRIVQQGNHDQLVEEEGIYRRIYLLQASIEVELAKEISYGG